MNPCCPGMSTTVRLGTVIIILIAASSFWHLTYQGSNSPSNIGTLLESENIPGAVLALRNANGGIQVQAFGHSVNAPYRPLSPSARFPIASLSKPITAATVRKLAKRGYLRLDDHASVLLPELANLKDPRYRQITINQLLQHNSGLNQLSGDPFFHESIAIGCKRAIAISLQRQLESPPGQQMHYSNVGYCLLGKLIERATHMSYEDAVHSALHIQANSPLTLGPPPGIEHEGPALNKGEWQVLESAGGWFSDAETLVSVLAIDAHDPMIVAIPMASSHSWYYGLGWRVWPDRESYKLTHFGSLPGMFSTALAYPDGRAAVILLNGRPKDNEVFAQRLYQLLEKKLQQPEQISP